MYKFLVVSKNIRTFVSMKSLLGGLFYLVAYFVFTFALMYFMSYIVYDVSHLYSIPYLMNFTVGNFFGFWFVYQLITSKKSDVVTKVAADEPKKSSVEQAMSKDLKTNLTYGVFLALLWGIAHVMHYVFFK